jgi:AcrR family transcriptional regulator
MASERRKYESPRQLERQSNILASAREMLSEVGYAGMTMRGLADRAGVAPATLYNLYGGKAELILAAVEDLLQGLAVRAAEVSDGEGISAILATAKVTGEQTQATPRYAEAMTRALFNVERDDPLVDVLFARGHPFIARQLAVAQEKGEILADVNTELLALHLTGQNWTTLMLWMMGMLPLDDLVVERERQLILTLLGVTRGSAKRRLQARLDELGWNGGAGGNAQRNKPARRKTAT